MASSSIPSTIGTPEYLPGLVARARASYSDLPLDTTILQSLLICLIAQPRLPAGCVKSDRSSGSHVGLHLILRTKEEDIGLVVNLVTLMLQHIVGVTTHKHKILPKQPLNKQLHSKASRGSAYASKSTAETDHPNAFLRSLFFRRVPHTSFSSHRSSTPRPRADTTPRSGATPLPGTNKNVRNSVGHVPQRSSSFLAPSSDGEDEERFFDASSLASSRRPLISNQTPSSTMRSRMSKGRPSAQRFRTDPLPLSSMFTPPGVAEEDELSPAPAFMSADSLRAQKSAQSSERAHESGGGTASALPKAVVVSGLEHTTPPCQRSLMRVLTERRVVFDGHDDDGTDPWGPLDVEDGTWNLPDGFLMVYVCKHDPHERPAILGGLLDKFSMSADVSLQPSVRQSYQSYRGSHATPRGTPAQSPLSLPHPSYFAAPTPVHHSPARRTTPLPAPTPLVAPALPSSELAYLRTLARPHPVAAPIFYPSVYATAHTQFPTAVPLPAHAALHPSLEMYVLDLFAATRHHPALDGTLLTMRAHADAEALARAFRVLNGDTVGAALVHQEARMGDGQTAAEDSLDGRSWTDGSAESLGGRTRGHGSGSARKASGSDDFGFEDGGGRGHGMRLRVEDEDGEGEQMVDMVLEGSQQDMSAAEALDAAVAKAWPEVWDVSEEDVARIFPRVVSHRLRVRRGPDEELLGSVMWPACGVAGGFVEDGADGVRLGWERKSVKELLVRILADV
ncbi:hypothetical protein C8Q80DRAFT_1184938 [Daedaleopsis nitida]|nr:hypothetical protein C8Q80DRAFT_1184938 [Daedaleopsis nitida]